MDNLVVKVATKKRVGMSNDRKPKKRLRLARLIDSQLKVAGRALN